MHNEYLPKVLYKYYPPASWKYIFEDWTIRFTPVNDLNDPFECKPHHDGIIKNAVQYKGEIDNLLDSSNLLRNDKIGLKKMFEEAYKDDGKSRLPYVDSEMAAHSGILSLTENCENLLMWAHYGAAHTGFIVALNFDCSLLVKKADSTHGSVKPEKVSYGHQRQLGYLEDAEKMQRDYFLTKSHDWEYESEWRVRVGINSDQRYSWKDGAIHGVCQIQPSDLDKVIFGANMPDEKIKEHCRHLRAHHECQHIKLLQSKLHETEFKLIIEEIPSIFFD